MSQALLIPMARNRHDMAVRDSSIRPEGDCCGTDRVVGINSRQLSCLTNFLHHVVKFIDAERLVVVPNGIGKKVSKVSQIALLKSGIATRLGLTYKGGLEQ